MITSLVCICALQAARPARGPIPMGWHDEFSSARRWLPIAMENKATVNLHTPGQLQLSLGQVPSGWPYEYQWSGLKRNIEVDISRYPVLMAYVGPIQGYAHLDIDVLDDHGKAVKGIRSTTLNVTAGPAGRTSIPGGVVVADLSKELLPITYKFQIRLIVGGPNSGCSATYHWLRFVEPSEVSWLTEHPNFPVRR